MAYSQRCHGQVDKEPGNEQGLQFSTSADGSRLEITFTVLPQFAPCCWKQKGGWSSNYECDWGSFLKSGYVKQSETKAGDLHGYEAMRYSPIATAWGC